MIGLVFVAVLLALIWGVVIALELPLVIAVIPTVTAVIVVLGIVVFRLLKARQAAAALEGNIKSQGAADEESVRPDQKPEVRAMRAEFNKALASLKTAKGSKGGASALAVLPWYMIIGPPGGGKSTALRNSGLQFPYVSKRGGGVKGVGGTRNCEWWFTNEAIILDTAGRYAVEEDDHDEWFAFLDTVVKSRPRKPINGLIVAISLSELMGAEEEAAERGTQLRERVDEVLAKLRMNVPVYLLFTKVDLVAGFVEMFGDLDRTERQQVWGFTESLGAADGEGASALFQQRFAELIETIEHRALVQLQKHRRVGAREKLWQFPRELSSLQANLSEFIGALFAENPMTDTPPMRGVYFTSGTQEGKPFDRMMASMSEAFGVGSTAVEDEGKVEARSYFLKDLFSTIVFPDRDLAVTSSAETQRQKRLRLWGIAGAFGLALLFSVLPGISFFKNLALVHETQDAMVKSKAVLSSSDMTTAVKKLEPLRAQVAKLKRYSDDGPPISMRMGMYAGDALLEKAGSAYIELTRKLLIERVLQAESEELKELAAQPELTEATTEVAEAVGKLKLQLLLSGPKADDEPQWTEDLNAWVGQQIVSRWVSSGEFETEEAQNEALAEIELYVQLVEMNVAYLAPRDPALIKSTRHALSKVPVAQLTLSSVLTDPSLDDLAISLSSLIGPSRFMKGDKGVRGAFTRKGWETVKSLLNKASDDSDSWVLGLSRSASSTELRVEYFHMYLSEWKQFIESIRVEPPRGNEQAMEMLEELTRTRPYTAVFTAIALNTRVPIDNEAESGLKTAIKKSVTSKISSIVGAGLADAGSKMMANDPAGAASRQLEMAFVGLVKFGYAPPKPDGQPPTPTPLLLYMEDLEKLRDALRSSIENPADRAALMSLLSSVRIKVKSSVDQQEPGWRPTIERLVWPPISWLTKTTLAVNAEDSGNKWCSQVALPYTSRLTTHYPFKQNGKDASLDDTSEFYRPGGLIDAFYESVLKKDVQRSGDRFEFVKSMGDAPQYTQGLLLFLRRSKEIQSALFPPQGTEPRVDFSVQVHGAKNVASTTLTIDGDTYEYRNGAEEWHAMKWPGTQKGGGASIRFKSKQGITDVLEFPGEWGLMRLLEAGTLGVYPGERFFAITWDAPTLETKVVVHFRPARTDNPFFRGSGLLDVLRGAGVAAPGAIGISTPACRK